MNYNLKDNKYSIKELENIISSNELTNNDWIDISYHQVLTEAFIDKYKDRVYWGGVSYYAILTESFIKKYKDKIDWDKISYNKTLTESMIDKYSDCINW